MAAPRRNRTDAADPLHEKTRAKIQTSQLVNRLNANSLGDLDKEMTTGQIASARILLDKSLPSLQAVELTGQGGGPVQYEDLTDEDIDDKLAKLEKESRET